VEIGRGKRTEGNDVKGYGGMGRWRESKGDGMEGGRR